MDKMDIFMDIQSTATPIYILFVTIFQAAFSCVKQ